MNIVEMYGNGNVITWKLPVQMEMKRTVDKITEKEEIIFNEFLLTFVSSVAMIVSILYLPFPFGNL